MLLFSIIFIALMFLDCIAISNSIVSSFTLNSIWQSFLLIKIQNEEKWNCHHVSVIGTEIVENIIN